ncbi:MAG: hypothetical protein ABIE70_02150 [bacterium]
MSPSRGYEDYSGLDLTRIIVKPLYFGMLVNIIAPMAGLFVCYWLNNQDTPMENRVGDFANTLYYIIGAVALSQAGLALWWRQKSFARPMVRSMESFEDDLRDSLIAASKPVFILIAAISLWGYLYFFLTGRFNEGAFVVLFSFVVFQVIRPRQGGLKKLIDRQRQLVKEGKLLR